MSSCSANPCTHDTVAVVATAPRDIGEMSHRHNAAIVLLLETIVDHDNVCSGGTVLGIRGIGLLAAGLLFVSGPTAFAQTPAPDSSSAAPDSSPAAPDTSSPAPAVTLPSVLVVGVTPLRGSGIDI